MLKVKKKSNFNYLFIKEKFVVGMIKLALSTDGYFDQGNYRSKKSNLKGIH